MNEEQPIAPWHGGFIANADIELLELRIGGGTIDLRREDGTLPALHPGDRVVVEGASVIGDIKVHYLRQMTIDCINCESLR